MENSFFNDSDKENVDPRSRNSQGQQRRVGNRHNMINRTALGDITDVVLR